jgi:ribonuclease P/MRP protein subunit RPP1
MIKASNQNDLNSIIPKVRNKFEVVMVHGGDYDINRAACENSAVDVLCHPELGRKDSGLDHICIKSAQENNVAVEINFHEILGSSKKNRTYALSAMKRNVDLCRKYGAPVITTSGAVTKWGLRPGRDLSAILNILGMELGNAIDSTSVIPENIVKQNREKLSGKRWEGVSVVD